MGFPHQLSLKMKDIMAHQDEIRAYLSHEMHDLWRKLGIEDKLTGEVTLTKDPVTLGALNTARQTGMLN